MSKTVGISLKNLTKLFIGADDKEFRAVDDISLDILQGEFVTLLGPSGCGKTTTLRMIAGFDYPTTGDIYLGDACINNLTPDKRDTAMVFQSYALFPHCDVYNNIAYGLKIRHIPKAEMDERVSSIIELVGLTGMEQRYPNQLSGGQQQRVALARALVMEPKVLLFDEPLSNLDAKLRMYMRTEIRKIQQKVGITAVYVTHDQSEAMSISDRIIIMNKGIVEQMGTPNEVYYHPANEFVADFIGVANFLNATITAKGENTATVSCYDAEITIGYQGKKNIGDSCRLILRPEAISLAHTGLIKGKVAMSVFMGAYQDYQIQLDDISLSVQEYNPLAKEVFREGDEVALNFLPINVHII